MLKVQCKGRYFLLQKSLFKDYNKRLVGTTTSFFPGWWHHKPENLHKPCPREHATMWVRPCWAALEKRKSCCSRVLLPCRHFTPDCFTNEGLDLHKRLTWRHMLVDELNQLHSNYINLSTNHSETSRCILKVVTSSWVSPSVSDWTQLLTIIILAAWDSPALLSLSNRSMSC